MSAKKEHPNIGYLKSEVGGVIAKGLAVLYHEKPKFPVEYLAKWLLNYSKEKENEGGIENTLKTKELLKAKQKKEQQEQMMKIAREEEEKQDDAVIDKECLRLIQGHQYHLELLTSSFPNFLENRKQLTGVYIAQLDYPKKQIDPNDDEENAHFDPEKPKQLNYVSYSDSHSFMKGRWLNMDQGVTPSLFDPEAQNAAPEDEPKPEYVYISNVVREPKMHYFQIPRLGAYIAIPLIYRTCLLENSFDSGLTNRVNYLKEKAEIDEKERNFQEQIAEKRDNGDDFADLEKEYETAKEQWAEVKEAAFEYVQKDYVLCADTLGQDRELTLEEQKYLLDYVKLFAKCWEENEAKELSKDIDRHIAYLESIHNNQKEMAEQFNVDEEKHVEERHSHLEEFKEREAELVYETDCLRLEKLISILQEPEVKGYISNLSNYRVIKFPGILQGVLFLLGYKKEDINTPETNQLNWKLVKDILLSDEAFFKKVYNYTHRGPKSDPVELYSTILRLTKRLSKYNQEDVDNYNLGYGRLFKWFSTSLRLRKLDIEIRRMKKEEQRRDRIKKMEENDKNVEDREKSLEEHKQSLSPEDLEVFNQQEWEALWEEEHPLNEIPPEVVDDIDVDLGEVVEVGEN